jgi:hypothetical protein
MLSQKELIFKDDWKTLIILDACRYDSFEQINLIKGELKRVYSAGSSTVEWFHNTFKDLYYNTIYISANPYINSQKNNKFFKIIDVWNFGWDEMKQTVLPQEVTKIAIQIESIYPEKRKIIHYIQPHFPPLGEEKIWESWQMARNQQLGKTMEKKVPLLVEVIKEYGREKVYKAYLDNLEIVLREVEELIKRIGGKTIITSDHGEAFGENRVFSHPPKSDLEELRVVPYFYVEKG